MLLRESGNAIGTSYELKGVTDKTVNTGVENEDVLLDFADAIWGTESKALDSARDALDQRMGEKAVVEASVTALIRASRLVGASRKIVSRPASCIASL